MGVVALLIVMVLYLVTARDYLKRNDPGMALAFLAYALANLGFIINLITTGDKSR